MSTVRKYFTSVICAATLLFASQSIPTASAKPTLEDAHNSEVVITVQDNDEISAVESPSPNVQLRSAGERAPDCINAIPKKGFIQVYNHCDWDIRVKVIFAFGPDSVCKLVVAGTRTNISPHTGRIDGVVTC